MNEENGKKLMRPAEAAREHILSGILSGKYAPGGNLPPERDLAVTVGVTRPTLRETLRGLASEGWLSIRQGKPTMINDYWKDGGLRLLSAMARYFRYLPPDFVGHLLNLRLDLIPAMAVRAAKNCPQALILHLGKSWELPNDSDAFTAFDWELQRLMAEHSGNPLFGMIVNDFSEVFMALARPYFETEGGRASSAVYYRELLGAIEKENPELIAETVRNVMRESIFLWQGLQPNQ